MSEEIRLLTTNIFSCHFTKMNKKAMDNIKYILSQKDIPGLYTNHLDDRSEMIFEQKNIYPTPYPLPSLFCPAKIMAQ